MRSISQSVSAAPSVSQSRNDHPALRRLLDITIASLLLIVLFVPFVVICVVILRTSPGPAIYRQKRVGRGGKLFEIWKFRTMYQDADRRGPFVTSADDCRVTPIGRWLRDNKLDELPQFFNVLRGDMSLVGPRPQVVRFVNHFGEPMRSVVLGVRPGITGPTTLHFRDEERLLAAIQDREEYYINEILPIKLAMDAHYVETRHLRKDMQVLVSTISLFASALGRKIFRRAKPTAEAGEYRLPPMPHQPLCMADEEEERPSEALHATAAP